MDEQGPAPAPPARDEGRSFGRTALLVVGLAVLALIAFWFAVSVLPRWWSHRVGDQVDGDLTTGVVVGFTYGFVSTLLPLAVLGLVYRLARRSVWAWLLGGAVALVLAAPNLITLGIVLGDGSAAHAADRTLDVEAPWFRGGIVIGVLTALAVVVVAAFLLLSRRRARTSAREARERLAEERSRPVEPPPTTSPE